jgi:hypothetical protein
VEWLKYEPLVDAVDHFAGLRAGGVKTEVHHYDETIEGNQQASVFPRPAPMASGRLEEGGVWLPNLQLRRETARQQSCPGLHR